MKQATILLFLLLGLVIPIHSQVFYHDKKDGNHDVIGTFSYNLDTQSSAHFVVTKNINSKGYSMKPYYVNNLKEVTTFDKVVLNTKPKIISCHINDTILSLTHHKNSTLNILDFNIKTKSMVKKSLQKFNQPRNVFKLPNETIIINKHLNKNGITIHRLKNSNSSESYTYDFKKHTDSNLIFSSLLNFPTAINTTEFVKNGSISSSRSFYEKNHLYVVYQKKKKKATHLIDFKLEQNSSPIVKTYKNEVIESLETSFSYIFKNKLFKVDAKKENLNLNITNLSTSENHILSSTKELLPIFKDRNEKEEFFKSLKRRMYKLTMTVNETKSKDFKVRLDFVNTNSYNYQSNFMFHEMMWQHQLQMQQMNIPHRFGPNQENDESAFFYTKPPLAITFTLNQQLELIADTSELKYQDIDKKLQSQFILDNKTYKYPSMAFFENEFHYIYYHKNNQEVVIGTKKF